MPKDAFILLNLKFSPGEITLYFQCLFVLIIPCDLNNLDFSYIFLLFVYISPPSPVVIVFKGWKENVHISECLQEHIKNFFFL